MPQCVCISSNNTCINAAHRQLSSQNGEVLACALVKPLGEGADGVEVCELGAFCVHPAFRGAGRGDSMLDYLGTLACSVHDNAHALVSTRSVS